MQRTVFILACLSAASPAVQARQAQGPSSSGNLVRIAPVEASRFEETLRVLSARAKVVLVAEGTPVLPTLAKDQTPDVSSGVPLEEAVKRLAAAHDYRVTRRGDVFVLKKHYNDPRDLPSLTLEEGEAAARDVLRILTTLYPPKASNTADRAGALASSLTSEQLANMQNKPLPLAAFSKEQQHLLRGLALNTYAGQALQQARIALKRLQLAPGATLRVKRDARGQHIVCELSPEDVVVLQPFLMEGVSSSANAPKDAPSTTAAAAATTLGAVVARLSERAQARYIVDETLAAKRVTVFGMENVPPAQVMDALASVYGLRVKEEESIWRLTRPLWRLPRDWEQVYPSILRVLPEPLHRCLRVEERAQLSRKASAPIITTDPAIGQELLSWQRERDRLNALPDLLRQEATRRLSLAAGAVLEKAGLEGRVPLSTLGAPEREALAFLLMAHLLESLSFLDRPPTILQSFERLQVSGQVKQTEKGHRYLVYSGGVYDPASGKVNWGMGGGVPLPSTGQGTAVPSVPSQEPPTP